MHIFCQPTQRQSYSFQEFSKDKPQGQKKKELAHTHPQPLECASKRKEPERAIENQGSGSNSLLTARSVQFQDSPPREMVDAVLSALENKSGKTIQDFPVLPVSPPHPLTLPHSALHSLLWGLAELQQAAQPK